MGNRYLGKDEFENLSDTVRKMIKTKLCRVE